MDNNIGQAQTVQVPNYSGVNIQIFNPTVATPGSIVPASTVNAGNYSTNPCYPSNYYTQNLAKPVETPPPPPAPVAPVAPQPEEEKKKTEKRDVVQLTDDYIRNLESYLNSQKKDVRLMGAKEVLARLKEDESRKDDPALNALVNKMLQDPYQPVKLMALAALESRVATGNDKSVSLLQTIQSQKTGHGEDSLMASSILLKMSGVKTQKEFEIKDKLDNDK